jgi:hypothetical protein
METRELKLEVWKMEQSIERIIQAFEIETGLFVEDVFLIRENPTGNCGKLMGVDMKVIVEGSPFSIIKRIG